MKYTSHEVNFTKGKKLKNKLKEYRTQARMTQDELAQKVRVSSRTIISLEKGQYNPSIMLAYRLSLIFCTNIEDIFCLKENKKVEDKKIESL